MIPSRDLASTATTRTITGEAEAEFSLIRDKTRATSIQYPFEED
jgi:hypothetical protein